MPRDFDKGWDDYRHLIMQASDAIHQAIVDMPVWAQCAVLGSNLETVLKQMPEKRRPSHALTFIKSLLNNLKDDDDDDNQEDDACQQSSIKR